MSEKTDLVDNILESELKMFLTVPTRQKASCQEHPDAFRNTRKAQFLTWSEETLKSYLSDLKKAEKDGVNLMTQKYARMDNLIPNLKDNPLIAKIVEIQYGWQIEMFERYPHLMGRGRTLSSAEDTAFQTSFETYLRGELETYSDETLASLHRDVSEKHEKGENMTVELYSHMVKGLGYTSLEEAETSAMKTRG